MPWSGPGQAVAPGGIGRRPCRGGTTGPGIGCFYTQSSASAQVDAAAPPLPLADDAAVSPVIGVILMVAITVVLAATVFVLVNGFGEEREATPALPVMQKTSDRVTVVRAEPDLDWVVDFSVGGSCTPLLNGQPWPTGPDPAPLRPGDVLTGCTVGETLTVVHIRSGILVYSTTF
jgi:flagellin-like protein